MEEGKVIARRVSGKWQGEQPILERFEHLFGALRPCPFPMCKNDSQLLFLENDLFSVHCESCNSMGPEAQTPSLALAYWGCDLAEGVSNV